MNPNEQRNRNRRICRMYYRDGLTMPQIAERLGLSKQRIHAIIKRYGVQ
jgi:DNA-binding transcriptional regulator LsrR (DeoR family)